MHPGCLIAFEGIDGAGTTSQLAPVGAYLRAQGLDVVSTCEPSDGPIGRLIRAQLACGAGDEATLALLFAADRLAHSQAVLEPALARGAVVLCDRYVLSSYAYQAATLPDDWVRAINAQALPAQLHVFFRVDLACAQRRRARRGLPADQFETQARQQAVAARYEALLQALPAAQLAIIDANQSLAEVTAAICQVLASRLPSSLRRGA